MKNKKVQVGSVKSESNPKVTHKQFKENGKLTCTCLGFKTRQNCKHIKELKGEKVMAKSSNISSASLKKAMAVKGKTTRATVINLLLKNKGKVVSINSIKAAVKKLGFSDEKVAKRLKQKTPQVSQWMKDHNLKLTINSTGMKVTA